MVKIPRRLDELFPAVAMEKLLDVLQQPDLSGKVREALNKVGLHDPAPLDKVRDAWQQARSWIDAMTASVMGGHASYPRALNASGQMISNTLSTLPWDAVTAHQFAKAATGYQSSTLLRQHAEEVARRHFAGQAVAWLASCSDALRLLASAAAGADGVAVSRVDAVRILAVGDVRSMLVAASNPLIDVGAANAVADEDWNTALTGSRHIVVLVSPNNLAVNGAAEHRQNAIAAAHTRGATVVELLADGVANQVLADQHSFPNALQALQTGADVIVLPTQLLLGGPAGALVIGRSDLVNSTRRAAENIGGLLEGAALTAAVSALNHAVTQEMDHTSVAGLLTVNPENLKNRARRLAVQLAGLGRIGQAQEVELTTPLGPSPWSRYQLSSWAVRVHPQDSIVDLLNQVSRGESRQGLKLELIHEAESLAINLRFIPPQCDHELVLVMTGDIQETDGSPPS